MNTAADALAALQSLTNYERTRADGPRSFDLSRPRGLLERLGSPHEALGPRVVQVAGTKGKGSTARFLDAIFRAAGLRTGRFLSPHLESVLERIAVDDGWIAEKDFARHVAQVIAAVDDETTFFEAMLAAACLHFAEAGTDAVVLEVGLGGRLDATTAVPVTHTVITEISFDHTEILGESLESIAAEKAGTIRTGVPVWSGVDPSTPAGRVIRSIAREREAPYVHVPPPDEFGFSVNVLGRHQVRNAALAAAVAGDLPSDAVARGLAAAEQPGCCERCGERPTVILDGAHTLSSVEATLEAVGSAYPGRRPTLVFALADDKDMDGIAALLAPVAADVWCTRVDDRRGRDATVLAAHPEWRGRAQACEDASAALQQARAAAGPDGIVLVTGSLYLAGALRREAGSDSFTDLGSRVS